MEGWTILEFSRKWVTCDDKDRDVKVWILILQILYSSRSGVLVMVKATLPIKERFSDTLGLQGCCYSYLLMGHCQRVHRSQNNDGTWE